MADSCFNGLTYPLLNHTLYAMNLPANQSWLNNEPGPKALKIALSLYGTLETPGSASNPVIMEWAKEVKVIGWYPDDATAWCGLFEGICNLRAGWPVSKELLSALSWAKWGTHVEPGDEMLGDTLVFVRPGGGHVAKYIGESKDNFFVYGGNQSDKVGFEWVHKSRLFAARRAPWRVSQPDNVRKIELSDSGIIIGGKEA